MQLLKSMVIYTLSEYYNCNAGEMEGEKGRVCYALVVVIVGEVEKWAE